MHQETRKPSSQAQVVPPVLFFVFWLVLVRRVRRQDSQLPSPQRARGLRRPALGSAGIGVVMLIRGLVVGDGRLAVTGGVFATIQALLVGLISRCHEAARCA